ncbi:hypothetical protein S83_031807 [Arachis hypogaea]
MVLAKKPAPPSSPSRTAAARAVAAASESVAAASESVAVACGSSRRDTIETPHLVGARPSLPLELVAGREDVTAEEVAAAVLPHRMALENHCCSRLRTPCSCQTLSHSSLGSDHGLFMTGFVLLGVGAVFIDKDAPLEDEEIEVAEDDASLVKQIGQSFQYSKIESVLFLVNIHASSMYGKLNIDRIYFLIKARREEQIQAAHDEAIFGASALPPPTSTDNEPERENEKEVDKKTVVTSLLSETMMVAELRLVLLINLLLKSFSLT